MPWLPSPRGLPASQLLATIVSTGPTDMHDGAQRVRSPTQVACTTTAICRGAAAPGAGCLAEPKGQKLPAAKPVVITVDGGHRGVQRPAAGDRAREDTGDADHLSPAISNADYAMTWQLAVTRYRAVRHPGRAPTGIRISKVEKRRLARRPYQAFVRTQLENRVRRSSQRLGVGR